MRSVKFILLLFLTPTILAQDFEKIGSIQSDVVLFTTDELEKVYICKKDVIELYDPQGKFLFKNSGKRFGQISSIDATYSLKPIIFFKEQMEMMLLDNTLSLQGDVIPLDLQGYPQAELVCSSVNNNYWIFDRLNLELVRVNDKFNTIAETGRLDQLINVAPEPNFLIEYLNWVYLNDPANGIHVFDIFGTYSKTIPLTGLDRIQIRGNNIYFFKDSQFQSYNMKSFEQAVLEVPEENPIHVRKEKKRLYVQTESGIDIYRISTKD